MNIEIKPTGIDPQVQSDRDAVYRHAFEGVPLDPEVARRIEARAAKVTEETYRTHGLIDDATFQKLLDDDDET